MNKKIYDCHHKCQHEKIILNVLYLAYLYKVYEDMPKLMNWTYPHCFIYFFLLFIYSAISLELEPPTTYFLPFLRVISTVLSGFP